MTRVCIINAVGLTPDLLKHAPHISAIGNAAAIRSPIPAVTCTSQATLLTGKPPSEHGIVANGWYYRETQEIRFWQQANSLITGEKFYEGVETAKMFWWFNQAASVKYSATPKPHYGCDGSKVFDILDHTQCDLVQQLGPFPFFSFWGPNAGLPCSEWIADATAIVMRKHQPKLTMVYLPHLDYFQRLPHHYNVLPNLIPVRNGSSSAGDIGAEVVVVSEYGLCRSTNRSISIATCVNWAGTVRSGPSVK